VIATMADSKSGADRGKAVEAALANIEKKFGKGSIMRLGERFRAGRYHSLVVERESLPACLEVSAATPDGIIMGLRHRELKVEGVQFHPESILTGEGRSLLANFLSL
jgi:para-aminobenzoate synthetase component 2